MFENIFSHRYEGSNTTSATVDGAEVRYRATFVSDGETFVFICSVYHAGYSDPVAAHGLMIGDKIRAF